MKKDKPMLLVEFKDTTKDGDWKLETADPIDLTTVWALGFKIHDNNTKLVLAMMRSDAGYCSERVLILKTNITKITELEIKK